MYSNAGGTYLMTYLCRVLVDNNWSTCIEHVYIKLYVSKWYVHLQTEDSFLFEWIGHCAQGFLEGGGMTWFMNVIYELAWSLESKLYTVVSQTSNRQHQSA